MKIKLLSTILFVVFISCKKDEQKVIKKSEFVKTWFDTVRGMPFMSKLKINENRTFDYYGGACTSRFHSEGTWRIEKDTLILNSYKTNKCYWKENFGLICTKEEIDSMREDNKTIKDCKPTGEERYVIFHNERFYLRNDTLIHTKKNKNCPKLRIAFSSLEKVRKNATAKSGL